jgi:hypothetical protein
MTLAAVALVRRFLCHILPSGFVKIRHYGLLANGQRAQRLHQSRVLLLVVNAAVVLAAAVAAVPPAAACCPVCGSVRWQTLENRPRPSVAVICAVPLGGDSSSGRGRGADGRGAHAASGVRAGAAAHGLAVAPRPGAERRACRARR